MNLRTKPGRAVMTARSRSIIGTMSMGETCLEIAKSQVYAAPAATCCCNGYGCSVMSASPGLRAVRLRRMSRGSTRNRHVHTVSVGGDAYQNAAPADMCLAVLRARTCQTRQAHPEWCP